MYIREENVRSVDFCDLQNNCWGGAVSTIKIIEENGKGSELIDLLEVIYCDELPTETELNDFLWFDADNIFAKLGITEEDERDDE